MVQLYWEQFLFDGALRLRAGQARPRRLLQPGPVGGRLQVFQQHGLLGVSGLEPSQRRPGMNAQWYITHEWTLTGGMTDVQGKKTHAGFDTIDDGNFFSAIDVTWSPTFYGLRATTASASSTATACPTEPPAGQRLLHQHRSGGGQGCRAVHPLGVRHGQLHRRGGRVQCGPGHRQRLRPPGRRVRYRLRVRHRPPRFRRAGVATSTLANRSTASSSPAPCSSRWAARSSSNPSTPRR